MTNIQIISSKNELMNKAIKLQGLSYDLKTQVDVLKNTLGSVKNYDNTIDIAGTADILFRNFVNVSTDIDNTIYNIKKYICELVEFDNYDLNLDDELLLIKND